MARRELLKALRSPKFVLASIFLILITSLPQVFLLVARGSEWNGSCAYLDTDELAYSAYTNALIDGRPRRNDPYTGQDNNGFETLFSIQFFPAYLVALPAKLFGYSASTAFIILQIVATLTASIAVFIFLLELTNNVDLASIGVVGVLCLGAIAALSPFQLATGIHAGYDLFPFLRRYIPAVPFPLVMLVFFFTWRALTRNPAWAILSGLAFAFLVYSYFFLWTAMVAWLFTIVVVWFIGRPQDRQRLLKVTAILAGIGIVALLPYSWLLMHRANTIDRTQLLQMTHMPDLLRAPEIYGIVIAAFLVNYVRKKSGFWHDQRILFIASFVISPFLIFNQRVLTGRSLQPFHYEEFVTNYWIILAFFLALGFCWRDLSARIRMYLAGGTILIAVLVSVQAARTMLDLNVKLDKSRAVGLKLREQSQGGTVFSSDAFLMHSLPSISRNPVLWARHLYTFSNVDLKVQKTRFYQYLYYSGLGEKRFAELLRVNVATQGEVFGADRVNPVLVSEHSEITQDEIDSATRDYGAFVQAFDAQLAMTPVLSYAVVTAADDLSNLDRWYQRSQPERIGDFVVYHLTLRGRLVGSFQTESSRTKY
jgi:hypothetical protein